ncbi:hypothetical protein [Neobacillus sp. 19]
MDHELCHWMLDFVRMETEHGGAGSFQEEETESNVRPNVIKLIIRGE